MRKRLVAALAFAPLLALAASALTLVYLSDAEIVRASETIIVGRVTDVEVGWLDPDRDGNSDIYTTAVFEVEEVLKGQVTAGRILRISTFGGTIGQITHSAPGVPLPEMDQRLVLCLLPDAGSWRYSPVVGISQGRWIIRRDEQGNDFARREFDHAKMFGTDGNGRLVERALPSEAEEPLPAVLQRLRAEVR